MKAYINAKTELSDLRKLHAASCFAFEQTEKVLRYRINNKQSLDPNLLLLKLPTKYRVNEAYRLKLIGQLRELIFIRLISVLEAYLVDSVRDVFFLNKHPFKDQDSPISFTQAEILSISSLSYVLSKIINKECRRLTSGGFTEISKYYRSHFDVDLYTIPPGKVAMREYHERRHIFVHRLGVPDDKYRQAYAFTGRRLEIGEEYLQNCIENFTKYIGVIHEKLNVIAHAKEHPSSPANASVTYLIILQKGRASDPEIISENYHFWVGDEIYALRDILRSKQFLNDRDCQIRISGSHDILAAYHKRLKQGQKQNHYLVSVQENVGLIRERPNSKIGASELEIIQKVLPPQPWPTGIHKTVAQQLDLSASAVSYAIKVLISRGIFSPQVNGSIVKRESR